MFSDVLFVQKLLHLRVHKFIGRIMRKGALLTTETCCFAFFFFFFCNTLLHCNCISLKVITTEAISSLSRDACSQVCMVGAQPCLPRDVHTSEL